MIDRIRTLTVAAAGAAVLFSGLGLAAVAAAGTAHADVGVEYYSDGTPFYYYYYY
jgi:ABC-type sugar transport system substrate-binding protein